MKQLIPQSKIDVSAKETCFAIYGDDDNFAGDISTFTDGFNIGVQFAVKEIEPLMLEFAVWCVMNYLHKGFSSDGKEIWVDIYSYNNYKTTQQLLEEFINDKQIKK